MNYRKIKNKGFTLIELLVVIAIIGILSSVVLSNLLGARVKARDANRSSDIKQLQTALELYRNKNGVYPTDLENLVASGFIGKQPIDPLGNQVGVECRVAVTGRTKGYCYAYNTDRTKYHLGAQLEVTTAWAAKDSQFNSTGYTGAFNGAALSSGNYYIYDISF